LAGVPGAAKPCIHVTLRGFTRGLALALAAPDANPNTAAMTAVIRRNLEPSS
jgi:hypothetical protein